MTIRIFQEFFMRGTFLFLVLFSGCMSVDKQPLLKQKYNLDVSRGGEMSSSTAAGVLKVRRFRASSSYEGMGLVYRTGEVSYESDFYNEFLSSPALIITEIVQKWLKESSVFENVTDDTSIIEARYLLEGKVVALYGDYVNTDKPSAVVEILFSVINNKIKKDSMVFQKSYRVSEAIDSRRPADLVRVYNRCLEKILTELENDLRESLRQK
jgi:cholesterol transport system auxiliary component